MLITGVYETYEGLADFGTFEEYLEHWIKPNILADLETVFEGARRRWDDASHAPGTPGRGDFVMATALLAVFDHFGAFLANPGYEWIKPDENIARVARRVPPSLTHIYSVLAHMGRHALTHGAWPQTALILDLPVPGKPHVETWAFGLSFNANSDPRRHDTFHWKPYRPRPGGRERVPQKVIKLVLNVHNLRRLLVDSIERGELFAGVTAEQFTRVKRIAELVGSNRNEPALKKLTRRGPASDRHRLCGQHRLETQIGRLIAEAKRLHVPEKGEDEKTPRDYNDGGLRPD